MYANAVNVYTSNILIIRAIYSPGFGLFSEITVWPFGALFSSDVNKC